MISLCRKHIDEASQFSGVQFLLLRVATIEDFKGAVPLPCKTSRLSSQAFESIACGVQDREDFRASLTICIAVDFPVEFSDAGSEFGRHRRGMVVAVCVENNGIPIGMKGCIYVT